MDFASLLNELDAAISLLCVLLVLIGAPWATGRFVVTAKTSDKLFNASVLIGICLLLIAIAIMFIPIGPRQ